MDTRSGCKLRGRDGFALVIYYLRGWTGGFLAWFGMLRVDGFVILIRRSSLTVDLALSYAYGRPCLSACLEDLGAEEDLFCGNGLGSLCLGDVNPGGEADDCDQLGCPRTDVGCPTTGVGCPKPDGGAPKPDEGDAKAWLDG